MYNFWDEWKDITELEKKAIRSLLSAKERILNNIPNENIIAIYVKGSLIQRELLKDSDVDLVVILRDEKYLNELYNLNDKNTSKFFETNVQFISYTLDELETGKFVESRIKNPTAVSRFEKHLRSYKLIYGKAPSLIFKRTNLQHLRSSINSWNERFLPDYKKGAFKFDSLIKQTFWLVEDELMFKGFTPIYSWHKLSDSVSDMGHIVHTALKLRRGGSYSNEEEKRFIERVEAYLKYLNSLIQNINNIMPIIEEAKNHILNNTEYAERFSSKEVEKPYCFTLKNKGKEVYFFGTTHISDPSDPMFEKIKSQFDSFKPDIVYIEGIPPARFELFEKGIDGWSDTDLKKRGEPSYVAGLVHEERKNRPIGLESPEPSSLEQIAYLEKKGFERKDIFRYHFLAHVAQFLRRTKGTEDAKNKDAFLNYIKNIRFMLTSESLGWPEEEVKKYKDEEVTNLDLNNGEVYTRAVDPMPWKNKARSITNEISEASGRIRDEYIIERVAEGMKTYSRLLIVYGYSHAVVDEPAFKYLMERI